MKRVILLSLAFLAFSFSAFCQSEHEQSNNETITISTYYPSPYGVYRELEVKGRMAVGNVRNDTNLGHMSDLQEEQLYVGNSLLLKGLSSDPPNGQSIEGQIIIKVKSESKS